jgi:hypothetical protein
MQGCSAKLALPGRGLAAAAVLAVALGPSARAQEGDIPPPAWPMMEKDARSAFRTADDGKVLKVERVGTIEWTDRPTSIDVITVAFQSVDLTYEARFQQVEKQRIKLHYEWESGHWAMRGFQWGDAVIVRPGKYPPPPPAPTTEDVVELVREPGMQAWRVPPDHVEKVQVTGKPHLTWEGDKPIAVFDVPVKVSVLDALHVPNANPPVVWKPRYLCNATAVISLERGVWNMRRVDAGCGETACNLADRCVDSWKPGARTGQRKRRK